MSVEQLMADMNRCAGHRQALLALVTQIGVAAADAPAGMEREVLDRIVSMIEEGLAGLLPI